MRRDRLEQKVLTFIKKQRMAAPGERIMLAVSGGADSMALLSVLYTLAPHLRVELAVVHLDHSLRPTSWQEAQLVEEYCRRLGLPIYSKVTDVGAYCRENKLGLEAGAREVRHRWLQEAAAQFGAQHIATAHHQDDQVETILLHMLRGSGIKGLSGMEPVGGRYIRPLLSCSKIELTDYLERKGVLYIEDETNTDTTYLRNRVRHQLLPLLEKDYNSNIRSALYGLGEVARQQQEWLDLAADKAYSRLVEEKEPGLYCIDLPGLLPEPEILQAQIIMRVLAVLRGQDDYTRRDVESVLRLAVSEGSARVVRLKNALLIRREYEKLYLKIEASEKASAGWCYHLTLPGQIMIPERGLKITASRQRPVTSKGIILTLAANEYPAALEVRNRRRGDRIVLPGGTKKLSDWFVDHKVPYQERDQRLILADGEQVIWIEQGPISLSYRRQNPDNKMWVFISNSGDQGFDNEIN